MEFKKIDTVLTVDKIIEQMLMVIRSDEMGIGDKLPSERHLAEMMGVSRSTLREAITTLSQIGILEIQTGKGTFIRSTDISGSFTSKVIKLVSPDINTLLALEMRTILEPGIAALVAEKRDDDFIARTEKLLHEEYITIEQTDRHLELDKEFHLSLAKATGNILIEHSLATALAIWFDDYWDKEVSRVTLAFPENKKKYFSMHQKIFDAIKDKDPKRAYREMENHFANVKRDVLSY